MRDAALRLAELRAIVLTGAEIDQVKRRAEACLNRHGESMPVTPLWCPEPIGAPRKLRFDGRRWYAVTTIRILDPVDPRRVWDALRTIIEAEVGYEWIRYPPGSESFGGNGAWYANSDGLWYSDVPGVGVDPIGAAALAIMHYGGEGSALNDTEYADFPNWEIPPPGFVEVHLLNGDHDRHDEFADKLTAWAGGTTAECDHYTGRWKYRKGNALDRETECRQTDSAKFPKPGR